MPFESKSLDDYIDVAQRIADFREKYPEGTLQPAEPWRTVQVESQWCRQCIGRRSVKIDRQWKQCSRCGGTGLRDQGEPCLDTFIVYVAAAYRTPDDPRPGVGVAWEPYPGQTPYTFQSELMNAETSAQGRAIIAVGASDAKRGIASREEVRNRQAERDDGLPTNRDGSLSRSRTSDEEKTAAGVMTDSEQRAHNQLERDTLAGRTPRVGEPVEDLWATGPSGLAPETDPEDLHGTATADQIRSLQAAFAVHGIGAGLAETPKRAAKIAWLVERFGPDIHSSKDLSYTQAAKALQELA